MLLRSITVHPGRRMEGVRVDRVSRIVRLLAVAIVATGATLPVAGAAGLSAALDASGIVAGSGLMARTDGEYVVWVADGTSAFDPAARLWARRLDGGEPFLVTTTAHARGWPAIDDGVVVWLENRPERECPLCHASILGKDLASGREFVVSTDVVLFANYQPSISGSRVVWTSGTTIWARDIAAMSASQAVATVGDGDCYHRYAPVISGDRIVWMECYEPAIPAQAAYPNYRILTKRLGEDAPTVVVDEPGNPIGYDLDGDRLVYASPTTGITVVDLASGARHVAGSGRNPTIDGRLVLWEAPADPWDESNPQVDLAAFDLATSTAFAAVEDQGVNLRPDAVGGVVVWQQTDHDIFGAEQPTVVRVARVNDLLPAAPRPQPPPDPNLTFFPETGHTLRLGFRAFWEHNGGLPVFGFPLTEELREPNADTGEVYTVLFTERQRFEYHPENAGTSYEVLLGRLGAELLTSHGRDWRDFPTADPGAGYFQPATGHAIDARFWPYWSSHGLDLGDPGVSFRESLALFGYPLSEPMLETNADGDTVLTQYFERAVFEWHPGNPDEWRVLLRRLGAEEVSRRGW